MVCRNLRQLQSTLTHSFAGVFFLFSQGRLKLCRGQPAQALQYYQRALEVQNQYRNLHHISYWERAIAYLALWDISASLDCWKLLHAEATVSNLLHLVFDIYIQILFRYRISGLKPPMHMVLPFVYWKPGTRRIKRKLRRFSARYPSFDSVLPASQYH